MPDAARREDMLRSDAPLLRQLRLWLLRTPLALPLVGVVGTLLGASGWVALMVAASLAAALRLWRIMCCTLLCAGIAALHVERNQSRANELLASWPQGGTVEIEGTVIELLGRGCLLRLEGEGVTIALRGESLPYAEGDRVRALISPRAEEPPPAVAGMFDRAAWRRSRGVVAEADYLRGEWLGSPFSWALLRGCATNVRHSLARRLMPPGTADEPRRQILCALVLGARELAEPDTMLPFRRGGTLHAFAVSGRHVVMLAGLLWPLLGLLPLRPGTGRLLLLLMLGAYVIITGFSVPAVRAFLMLAILLMGLSLRRRVGLANAWCFAALLILLVEPWQLYSAGFLLSFAIYAAICMGVRLCLQESPWFGPDAFIPPRIYTKWESRLRRCDLSLRGLIVVSLVAYTVSLPLTGLLFHSLNPWSFLTNIVIAPLVPLVMLAGLAMLCLSGIPLLGALASWLALHAAGCLLLVSQWFAYLPGAYVAAELPRPEQAAMVLGTGYGGSVCVLGNPGLLIDCGNELTAALQVEPALFHSGYQPAALLLSRSSRSHSGGVPQLLRTWPRMQLIHAADLGPSPLQLRGQAGHFTLYPAPHGLLRCPATNAAPVIRWQMPDGRKLLYLGDAARSTWEQLPPEARQADILILGHNRNQPIDDPFLLREVGARLILLLPSASGSALRPEHAGQGCQLLRLGERECLSLP